VIFFNLLKPLTLMAAFPPCFRLMLNIFIQTNQTTHFYSDCSGFPMASHSLQTFGSIVKQIPWWPQ
jgi:hypothetical protein